ncbi:hypothetical protein FHR29_003977 [Sphingobacterium sp. JUb56]|nr:hypothetical protein [Sphingobacterium sp. JUb56]
MQVAKLAIFFKILVIRKKKEKLKFRKLNPKYFYTNLIIPKTDASKVPDKVFLIIWLLQDHQCIFF